MRWLLAVSILIALAAELLRVPMFSFAAAAVALIGLSKIMGDATEHLAGYYGDRTAGLLNVSFGNLAELIIIFAAIRANLIDMVQAGIVGSMMGNLLLTTGVSIYLGCRKNGTLTFSHDVGTLYMNQLLLIACVLMLLTFLNGEIPVRRHVPLSYLIAGMLAFGYVWFYHLSCVDKRFPHFHRAAIPLDGAWTKRRALGLLGVTAVGAYVMSELLMRHVGALATNWHLSPKFIGFILLPLLGNIAERSIAVVAAMKQRTDLSMAISIGSASQVGMIIAPCAVLFGALVGHPVTLVFGRVPLVALGLSVYLTQSVLSDDRWNINEGVMLIALYAAIVITFLFTV